MEEKEQREEAEPGGERREGTGARESNGKNQATAQLIQKGSAQGSSGKKPAPTQKTPPGSQAAGRGPQGRSWFTTGSGRGGGQGQQRMDNFLEREAVCNRSRSGQMQHSPPLREEEGQVEKKLKEDESQKELMRQVIQTMEENRKELREMRKFMEEERNVRMEMAREIQYWRGKVGEMEDRIRRLEMKERRKNIIIKGVEEQGEEKQQETEEITKKIIEEKLEVNGIKISEIARLGKKMEGKNRPILVKCETESGKSKIMRKRARLRGTVIFLDDDMPPEVREVRRKLLRLAKAKGVTGREIRWKEDKMIIGGKEYEAGWEEGEEILRETRGEEPKN